MPIPFQCPHCGLQTQVEDQFAGKSGPCAGCGQTITVPAAPISMAETVGRPTAKSSNFPVIAIVLAALLFGGLAVIGILVALLLPAVSAAREAARRAQCINQMKQVSLAMLQYESVHGTFPPAYTVDADGNPMHSWRVLILPYLGPEANALHSQYDFTAPWDSPQNQALTQQMPSAFRCPSDLNSPDGDTSYCVVTGPGMVFDGDKTTDISDMTGGQGIAQTLVLVENHTSGINWLEPRDVTDSQLAQGIDTGLPGCCSSNHVGGMCAAFADGHVSFLSETTNPEELVQMSRIVPSEPATIGFE